MYSKVLFEFYVSCNSSSCPGSFPSQGRRKKNNIWGGSLRRIDCITHTLTFKLYILSVCCYNRPLCPMFLHFSSSFVCFSHTNVNYSGGLKSPQSPSPLPTALPHTLWWNTTFRIQSA